MTNKKDLSNEDKTVWEEYVKNPSDVFDKDKSNIKNKRNNRFRFDLHGFSLNDANKKVEEIINYCIKNKYKELLLITGKGIHSNIEADVYTAKNLGKLKFSVPDFIKSQQELNKFIVSINEADKKDGGEGALLIRLKNL